MTCFMGSFEIFTVLLVIYVDIIIYCDIYLDKLQYIILYPGFVLTMFSGMTISVVTRKFYSESMGFLEIEH